MLPKLNLLNCSEVIWPRRVPQLFFHIRAVLHFVRYHKIREHPELDGTHKIIIESNSWLLGGPPYNQSLWEDCSPAFWTPDSCPAEPVPGPDSLLLKNLFLTHTHTACTSPNAALGIVEFSKYVLVYRVHIPRKNTWNTTWLAERKMWKIKKKKKKPAFIVFVWITFWLYAVHNLRLCGFLLEHLCLQAELRFLNHLNYQHRTNTHSLIWGFTRLQCGQVSLPIKPLRIGNDFILGNPK